MSIHLKLVGDAARQIEFFKGIPPASILHPLLEYSLKSGQNSTLRKTFGAPGFVGFWTPSKFTKTVVSLLSVDSESLEFIIDLVRADLNRDLESLKHASVIKDAIGSFAGGSLPTGLKNLFKALAKAEATSNFYVRLGCLFDMLYHAAKTGYMDVYEYANAVVKCQLDSGDDLESLLREVPREFASVLADAVFDSVYIYPNDCKSFYGSLPSLQKFKRAQMHLSPNQSLSPQTHFYILGMILDHPNWVLKDTDKLSIIGALSKVFESTGLDFLDSFDILKCSLAPH